VLFTEYGLSGTAVLDVSPPYPSPSRAKKTMRRNPPRFAAGPRPDQLEIELKRRMGEGWETADLVSGLLRRNS
jgi:predicted flavoprotein YhiN